MSIVLDGAARLVLPCGREALHDAADRPLLQPHRWRSRKGYSTTYVRARIGGREVSLHRFILNAPVGLEVDHWDGNGLNNRRSNIRICTHAENQRNRAKRGGSSRFKGVAWHPPSEKWIAQIGVDGHLQYLGTFTDEEEAGRAYDAAAIELFGDFFRLNFHN